MTTKQMQQLKAGDVVVYNDGRGPARAVVLDNSATVTLVKFDDRADTTAIRHSERAWTDCLSLE